MNDAVYSRELFFSSLAGQVILDYYGTIKEVNDSFNKMCGLPSESLIDKNITDIIFSEDAEAWRFAFREFFSEEDVKTEIKVRYDAGDRICWWKLLLSRYEVSDEIFVHGILVDITGEKDTEGKLIKAKQEAEKATEAKSLFLANMSHEIRTPIHTVTGLTELLQDTYLDSEQKEYVSQIGFSASVLLNLINDILDFSKIEARKLTMENIPFNLYEVVENAVDLVTLEAHRKGVEIGFFYGDNVPVSVVGDPIRLRQVLVNLFSNAVKFTKEGQVLLYVSLEVKQSFNCRIHFKVVDSGVGISRTNQEKLFESFTQADISTTREYGGTGLGLTISSNLVHMMGGEISVESELGKGSAFSFSVDFDHLEEEFSPLQNPPAVKLKVLVVDDNKYINDMLSALLREWGFAVTQTGRARDALSELMVNSTAGTPYDICFVDQILPGMDGWQMGSEVHANGHINQTAMVLMTLKGKGAEESKMKLLGWFQGYLMKPVKKKDLHMLIEDLFREYPAFYDPFVSEIPEWEDAEEVLELEEIIDDEEPEELLPLEDEFFQKTILVVEDHLVNQKLFTAILKKEGHDVVVAADGKEALYQVERFDPDLIFMDCQMPVMNGYDSTREIRNMGYKTPIVAVTASAVKGERERCLDSGMNDVITKPFKKQDIADAIDKWMNSDNIFREAGMKKNRSVESYEVFNFDRALERFMGEREVLISILEPFVDDLYLQMGNLSKLKPGEDNEKIRHIAHSIKGSSRNLDAVRLGNTAESLEESAAENDVDSVVSLMNQMQQEVDLFKVEIKNYIS